MRIFSLCLIITVFSFASCGSKERSGGMPGGFAVNVVAVKIEPQMIEEKVSVVGSMVANESVDVKTEIDGMVKEICFEEGQRVNKGDVLFVLDRDKLEASTAQAESALKMAQITSERMASLVDSGAVSKQEFDQAQSNLSAAQAQLDLVSAQLGETMITASFDGVMGERKVSVGQVVNKDTSLTVIIDADPMKADFHVPERYTGRLKEDQPVSLKVAAYPDDTFEGKVYFIDPQVDAVTRTVLVKARIANPDGKLRRGMFTKLELTVAQKPQAMAVPETALIPKGEDVFVFIVDAESKAQMVPVKTGLRMVGSVEIVSGLNAGDTVITEGFQKIGPGSPVKVNTAS